MLKKTLFEAATDAADIIVVIENWNKDATVFLYGADLASISETINIQIPTVENPAKDIDANWQNFIYDSTTYVLDANNMAQSLPLRGTYRIHKPTTSTAVGIRIE